MKEKAFTRFVCSVCIASLATIGPIRERPSVAQSEPVDPGMLDSISIFPSSSPGIFTGSSTPVMAQPIANDAQNVGFVGHIGGITRSTAVQGSYAYIGEGMSLTILDVSNPVSPTVVSKTIQPGIVEDVAVAENYAYVVASAEDPWQNYFQVIDISDLARPITIGSHSMQYSLGYKVGVAISGHYAYVAAPYNGLRVVDVSDPTSPTEVGFYDMGLVYNVAVAGSYAYVAACGHGLRVVDISNPANPVEVGFCDTPVAHDVAVVGQYAYVADGYDLDNDLWIVDISDPTNPIAVSSYNTPGNATSVAVVGEYAYVGHSLGLQVIQVSDPANPVEVGFCFYEGLYECDVAVAGGFAYVTARWDGLRIVDVSNPASPVEIGVYGPPAGAYSIAVVEGYVYIANDCADDLLVIDASVLTDLQVAGRYVSENCVYDIAVVGDYAYMTTGYRLEIADVSNPTNPTETGFFEMLDAMGVTVNGDYAYILAISWGGGYMQIVDVSDPTNPQRMGSYTAPRYDQPMGIAVADGYAYIVYFSGCLRVVDISDPAVPQEVGFYDLPWTYGVAVNGNYAYVAGSTGFPDFDGRLWVIDISDPANPTEVGLYYGAIAGSFENVVVAEEYAYVAGPVGRLQIVDISDPTNPVEAGFYEIPVYDVAVQRGLVYVAGGDPGLPVLPFVPPSIPGQVTDGNGEPIVDVKVTAGGRYSTTTKASGQYTLTNALPGTYTLIPNRPGYLWSPASRTVTFSPNAARQDFVGWHVLKESVPRPPQALNYGDTLTYTVGLVYPDDRTVVLYDRVPTYTTYISGSLSGPADVIYDPVADAISGTLTLTATIPVTISFAAQVEITGTAEWGPLIINQACAHPVGGELTDCEWSNEAWNFTYVWQVCLPSIFR